MKLLICILAFTSLSVFATDYQCKFNAVRKQSPTKGYSGKFTVVSQELIAVETYRTVCALLNNKIVCKNVYEPEDFTLQTGGTYLGKYSSNTLVLHERYNSLSVSIFSNFAAGTLISDFRKCREVN